jgi:hypothetical protein
MIDNIKKDNIYGYKSNYNLHSDTLTVKINSIDDKGHLIVESQQTGEVFQTNKSTLITEIEINKEIEKLLNNEREIQQKIKRAKMMLDYIPKNNYCTAEELEQIKLNNLMFR